LTLKVVGSGPLVEDIKAYIKSHQLRNVEILGFVTEEQKYDLLRGALCCVLPSECYEAFPLVLLESAAAGTPVVASRLGSLASLVSEAKTGQLFTPGDSDELRATLEKLTADTALAIHIGEEAREWLETKHTPDVHYKELIGIYEQVKR